MSRPISISFSHCGFYVMDLDRMVDFYTRFLGFIVSDRGTMTSGGGQIAFLTRDPEEHHQLVFASGRPKDLSFNIVNQVSLRVDSPEIGNRVRLDFHCHQLSVLFENRL